MLSLVALLATPILALLCANQDFSPDVFITRPLTSGVTVNNTLCPEHWVWFSINTRTTVTYTRLEQQGPDWVERAVNETLSNAVSLSVDAGYDYTRFRFTTLAVLMVNGTPPVDIDKDEPYSAAEYSETFHVWEPYTDRETLAMGFNETLGVSCQEPLAEEIFVGIQCVAPEGADPCIYAVSASLLPNQLHHGVDLTARLKPAWPAVPGQPSPRHYYRMSLGPYDTLQVHVSRVEDGRPLHEANGESLGVGLAGGVYVARGECPTNSSEQLEQACTLGLNTTVNEPCKMGSFCSLEEEAGELVMLIEAEVLATRPVTYFDLGQSGFVYGEYEQHSTGAVAYFLRNMVGPDGLRPETTLVPPANEFDPPRLPRYNDPRNYIPLLTNWYPAINARNDLRVDHGSYHLTVRHLQFEKGGLLQGEVRPGCVSFGQWRYFHIRTRNAQEATLSLHLQTSHGVSGLFLRQGARPTADIYDGRAQRGPGNALRLSGSACDAHKQTTWHIGVWLDSRTQVHAQGMRPTEFTLAVYLEDPTLTPQGGEVAPRGGDGVQPATGKTGDGFVCCGNFKYHLVPQVPPERSLQVEVKVTRGRLRALFLKHASCPRYPDDVIGEECVGFCVVRWLTTFDPYDGRTLTHSSDVGVVPNGDNIAGPDLRGEGDWYVGVLALPGEEAEYSLSSTLVDTPPFDTAYKCDRIDGPCPQQRTADGQSGAPLRGTPGRIWAVVLVASTAALARRWRCYS